MNAKHSNCSAIDYDGFSDLMLRTGLVLFGACTLIAGLWILMSSNSKQIAPPEDEVVTSEYEEGMTTPSQAGGEVQHVGEFRRREPENAEPEAGTLKPSSGARVIKGRITADGMGVAGATVEFLETWRPSFAAINATDANGNFEFDLSKREFEWSNSARKHLRVTTSDRGTFSFKVDVNEGQGEFNLELPTWTGHSYAVRVVDRMTGEPRPGVPLRIVVDGEFGEDPEVMTDTSGIARFLNQADELEIFAFHGWLTGDRLLAAGGELKTFEFDGIPEVVSLRAVDASTRETIVNANWAQPTYVSSWEGATDTVPEVWSFAENVWSWRASDNPDSTTCMTVVRAPGYFSRHVRCPITLDGKALEVQLQSDSDEALPKYVKVLANGEPVVGAYVEFQMSLAFMNTHLTMGTRQPELQTGDELLAGELVDVGHFYTDDDGCVFLDVEEFWGCHSQTEFEIAVTQGSDQTQHFIVPENAIRGHEWIEIETAPPTGTILFRLERGGDAVEINLGHVDASRPIFRGPVRPTLSDRFETLRIEPGTQLQVDVQAGVPVRWWSPLDQSLPNQVNELTLSAGDAVAIELASVQRGTISGKLVDGDGAPWSSNVVLMLHRILENGEVAQVQEDWGVATVETFRSGRFKFVNVPVGAYEIRVAGLGSAMSATRVQVGDSNVIIELPAQATLEVEIVNLHEFIDEAEYGFLHFTDGAQYAVPEDDVTSILFWPGHQETCFVSVDGCELQRIELPDEVAVGATIRRQVRLLPGSDIQFSGVPLEVIESIDPIATRVFARSEWISSACFPSTTGEIYLLGLPAGAVEVEFHSRDGEIWLRKVEAGLIEVPW